MKNLFAFLVFLLTVLATENYAQMPPHPDLLEKIQQGKIKTPYAMDNLTLIRSKGIDAPWSAPELETQRAQRQNSISRTFGPGIVPTDDYKALAILVEFSDKASQADAEYFDNLLFGHSTGTLRDYYDKISYGNLDIITVNLPSGIGWISAPQTYSYYVNGQNGTGDYPQNSQKLVEDIINLVNPEIDFSQYDNDGDGYVDALFIIHSGPGAEYTGNNNHIWSHAWTTSTPQILDGVMVYRYSIEPEYWAAPGDMTCGVFAHEMGHTVFGLPDLYDTDYSSQGLGNWSLMASGTWNGTLGSFPAFPDAWSHSQMGYLIPIMVTSNVSGQIINNVENTSEAYILQNNLCGGEYFLVENRQQIGYDTYIPGNGLCIYHIDNSVYAQNNNEWYPGHTSSGHYHVALEQADGLWSLEHTDKGDTGDPYPGTTNNINFRCFSIPDSKTYNLNETGIEVFNISSSSLTMNADFKVDTEIPFSQFTEQTSISLVGGCFSSVTWGDYDNDGDLDILLTGMAGEGENPVSKIYRNNGNNTFTEQTTISLVAVSGSSVAWGDYDNDSDLDILLTGDSGIEGPVSKIYRNNGDNTFADQISLTGVKNGSVAWGDYDNDGDLDILLTGDSGIEGPVSKIYRNEGNDTFTDQTSITLIGVFNSSAVWGDYDNDGDLDILLTGTATGLNPVSKIYCNNGNNTFTEQTSILLTGVNVGSVAWGDYDNDGFLDFHLSGAIRLEDYVPVSKIYHNNGDNTFTEQTSISLVGGWYSSVVWGDYDNDGDLDILLTGWMGDHGVTKIYRNDGDNTFTEQTSPSLTVVFGGSVEWGDYDNDGDLDILLNGMSAVEGPVSKIYRNNNEVSNTLPSVPSNLQIVVNGDDVTFSWDKSTDNETPQNGLTYNLAIGTSPGGVDILSPMSDINTGKRRIVSMGNTGHCKSWTIKDLPEGQYYWSVQAIDNCFAGSAFAVTKNFTIQLPGTIIITYPTGGEVLEPGNNPIITYSSLENSGYVNLDYSTDGGVTWNVIAANQLDDGDYRGWIVPNTPSTNCKVRVTDVDGNPSAISNGLFTIQGTEFTEQTSISLPGANSATWGDYDNDGDMDILLTGRAASGGGKSIYRNNGDNTFTEQTSISLTGTYRSTAAWGDYDNDGDLDIVLSLTHPYTSSLNLYRNNGNNSFTKLLDIRGGINVDWGDYDNDGDLDIVSSGYSEYFGIETNNGDTTFTNQYISYGSGFPAWGDYDNDGYLDILFAPLIYHNNGNSTFTEQTSISLTGVYYSSVAWGDYDNDSDLDILLTGTHIIDTGFVLSYIPFSKLYHNNGNNTFTEETSTNFMGGNGSVTWGDYDNDGYLDILLTGKNEAGNYISRIYRNNKDNTFTEQTLIFLTGVQGSSAAWGDYDNDGDLDILLAGDSDSGSVAKIYRNNITTPNATPTIPSNLKTEVNGGSVTFSWDKSTDNETPQNGLTYNLVIGTNPDTVNILSPMSDRNTGRRRIVDIGNAGHCNSKTIKGLSGGKYCWSVQAIDNSFSGSNFAATESFVIQSPETIIITYPKGGEIFAAGSNPIITYSSLGNSGYLDIDYSTDGGVTWDTVCTNQLDDGDFQGWIVPNTPSENCKIRITDVDGNPSVISEGLFTITGVVPVELVSFTVNARENKIMLNWKTATEINNYGFDLERKIWGDEVWEKAGFVQGNGNSNSPKNYEFIDNPVGGSKFEYRLKQIDLDGSFEYSDIVEIIILPTEYKLYQNYPNPFNPTTTIRFSVPKDDLVLIKIYDILGNEITTLVNEEKQAGHYEILFDGSKISSGVYFYKMNADNFSSAMQLMIIK